MNKRRIFPIDEVAAEAERQGVDPVLAVAIANTESRGRTNAVSRAGARGVMQLMPGTAEKQARKFGVKYDPNDPHQNVMLGVGELKDLGERYPDSHELQAAGYNAGAGAVDKYKGVPPYPETRGYVRKVQQDYERRASRIFGNQPTADGNVTTAPTNQTQEASPQSPAPPAILDLSQAQAQMAAREMPSLIGAQGSTDVPGIYRQDYQGEPTIQDFAQTPARRVVTQRRGAPGVESDEPMLMSDEEVAQRDAVTQYQNNIGTDWMHRGRRVQLRVPQASGRQIYGGDDATANRTTFESFVQSHEGKDREAAEFIGRVVQGDPFSKRPTASPTPEGDYQVDIQVPEWFDRAMDAYRKGGPDAAVAQIKQDAATLDADTAAKDKAQAGVVDVAGRLTAAQAEGLQQGHDLGTGVGGALGAAGYGAISGVQDAIAGVGALPGQIGAAIKGEYYNPANDPEWVQKFREAAVRTSAASSGEAVPDGNVLRRHSGAAGSMIPFALGGMAAGGSKLVAGGLGALQNASQLESEAIQAGATPGQIQRAYGLGAGVGALEAFGFKGDAPVARGWRGVVREIGGEVVEEGVQEGVSQTGNNLIASKGAGYDPKRKWNEGVLEAMVLGGVLGGTAAGGMRGIHATLEAVAPGTQPQDVLRGLDAGGQRQALDLAQAYTADPAMKAAMDRRVKARIGVTSGEIEQQLRLLDARAQQLGAVVQAGLQAQQNDASLLSRGIVPTGQQAIAASEAASLQLQELQAAAAQMAAQHAEVRGFEGALYTALALGTMRETGIGPFRRLAERGVLGTSFRNKDEGATVPGVLPGVAGVTGVDLEAFSKAAMGEGGVTANDNGMFLSVEQAQALLEGGAGSDQARAALQRALADVQRKGGEGITVVNAQTSRPMNEVIEAVSHENVHAGQRQAAGASQSFDWDAFVSDAGDLVARKVEKALAERGYDVNDRFQRDRETLTNLLEPSFVAEAGLSQDEHERALAAVADGIARVTGEKASRVMQTLPVRVREFLQGYERPAAGGQLAVASGQSPVASPETAAVEPAQVAEPEPEPPIDVVNRALVATRQRQKGAFLKENQLATAARFVKALRSGKREIIEAELRQMKADGIGSDFFEELGNELGATIRDEGDALRARTADGQEFPQFVQPWDRTEPIKASGKRTLKLKPEGGQRLSDYVRNMGGLQLREDQYSNRGELSYLFPKEGGKRGLVSRKGLSTDLMRSYANSEGYGPFETEDDFLQAVRADLEGQETFSYDYDLDRRAISDEDAELYGEALAEFEQANYDEGQKLSDLMENDADFIAAADRIGQLHSTERDYEQFIAIAEEKGLSAAIIDGIIAESRRFQFLETQQEYDSISARARGRDSEVQDEEIAQVQPRQAVESVGQSVVEDDAEERAAIQAEGVSAVEDYVAQQAPVVASEVAQAAIPELIDWDEDADWSATLAGLGMGERQSLLQSLAPMELEEAILAMERRRNDSIRGLVNLSAGELRALAADLWLANQERKVRVRNKELPAKYPQPAKMSEQQIEWRKARKSMNLSEVSDEDLGALLQLGQAFAEVSAGASDDITNARLRYYERLRAEADRRGFDIPADEMRPRAETSEGADAISAGTNFEGVEIRKAGAGYAFQSPYKHAEFIKAFNRLVGGRWSAEKGEWLIPATKLETAKELIAYWYKVPVRVEGEASVQAPIEGLAETGARSQYQRLEEDNAGKIDQIRAVKLASEEGSRLWGEIVDWAGENGIERRHLLALRAALQNEELAAAAKQDAIDREARRAATSPTNDLPQPTDAQKDAGNYKKAHISWQGLSVTIENPKGSTRSGIDAGGQPWNVSMSAHYGYVKGSEGADGDQVDVYIADNPNSDRVFVVDQVDAKTGKFDEHKAILGANDEAQAVALYDAHFSDGKGAQRRSAVTEMSVAEFKQWLKGDTSKPLSKPRAEALSEDAQAILRLVQKQNGVKRGEVNYATMMTNSRSKPAIQELLDAGRIVEQDGVLRVPAVEAAPSPLAKVGKAGTVGQSTHTKPSEITRDLNKLTRLVPGDSATDSDKRAARAIPTFQGGKTKMAYAATGHIRQFFGADARKITEIDDYFAGSGAWGAYLATTVFPNVKAIRIYEINPNRAAKVQVFHEQGNRVAELLRSPELRDLFDRVVQVVDDNQTYSGTAIASAVERESQAMLAMGLPREVVKGLLQGVVDHGNASFGTKGETGRAAVDKLLEQVAANATEAYKQVSGLRTRGVKFEYVVGSAYEQQGRQGTNVLSVIDPPYYGTKGYNGVDLVGLSTYEDTRDLLSRVTGAGNSVIYTDEAWWEKHDDSGKTILPPDASQNLFGGSARDVVTRVREGLQEFIRIPIAERIETLGLHNGIKQNATSSAVDESVAGRNIEQPQRAGSGNAKPSTDGGVAAGVDRKGEGLPATKPLASRRRVTNTPEFRRWFGDSKAVDGKGEPLVVYHGTRSDFSSFYRGFFTDNADVASDYADGFDGTGNTNGGSVMPVYLRITKPASDQDVLNAAKALGLEDTEFNPAFNYLTEDIVGELAVDEVIGELERRGFDGARMWDTDIADQTDTISWFVFRPNQVKSATGNNGQFDARNGNILASRRKIIGAPEFKRWFEGSQVVEADGSPKVVYHGTTANFDRFDSSRIGSQTDDGAFGRGFYFADDPEIARQYGQSVEGAQGQTMPVFLNINAPLELAVDDDWQFDENSAWQLNHYKIALDADGRIKNRAEVPALLQKQGYDGVVIAHPDYVEYLAFSPTQIKSAIGNRGTFNPDDPSILNSRRRWTETLRGDQQALPAEKVAQAQTSQKSEPVGAMAKEQAFLPGQSPTDVRAAAPKSASVDRSYVHSVGQFLEKADIPRDKRVNVHRLLVQAVNAEGKPKEIEKIKEQIERELGLLQSPQGAAAKALFVAKVGYEMARTLSFFGDQPHLRQALFLTVPPRYWAQAGRDTARSLKAIAKEHIYKAMREELLARPGALVGEQYGLYLGLTRGEEGYTVHFQDRIPVVRNFERAYKLFLDARRIDAFERYTAALSKDLTAEEFERQAKQVAELINVTSGRAIGKVGEKLDNIKDMAAVAFTAPNFQVSRFQTLGKIVTLGGWGKVPKATRLQFMGDVVSTGTVLIAFKLLASAAMGGDKDDLITTTDTDDRDFLKFRIGNTVIDVSGGLAQPLKLMGQIGAFYTQRWDEMDDYNKEQKVEEFTSEIQSFIGSRAHPMLQLLWRVGITGRDFDGQPIKKWALPWEENSVSGSFVPLLLRDVKELYQEDGARGLAFGTLMAFFGAGTKAYQKSTLQSTSPLRDDLRKYDIGRTGLRRQPGEPVADYKKAFAESEKRFESQGKVLAANPGYKSASDEVKQRLLDRFVSTTKRSVRDGKPGRSDAALLSDAGVIAQREAEIQKMKAADWFKKLTPAQQEAAEKAYRKDYGGTSEEGSRTKREVIPSSSGLADKAMKRVEKALGQ